MIRTVLISAALLAASVSAAAAQETVRVGYSDLNLASAEGAATFARRIDHAVAKVCAGAGPRGLDRAAAVEACRGQLRTELQAQVQEAMNSAGVARLAAR